MTTRAAGKDFVHAVRASLPNAVRTDEKGVTLEPKSTEEVALIVRLAREHEAKLSPPGAPKAVDRVPLRLRRMAEMVGYDEHAHLVHAQGGISLAALADELRRRGRTLPMRRDLPAISLGRWLALGAPGARCKDDDPVEQLVAGLTAVLPDGRVMVIRPAPRRAVGPDLIGALLGARGHLGIITTAHLVTRPRRPTRELHFLFANRLSAETARARLRGLGARPDYAEVVDAPEGSALLLQLSGEGPVFQAQLAIVREAVRGQHGAEVGAGDVPPLPAPLELAVASIVLELATELDPLGVLSAR